MEKKSLNLDLLPNNTDLAKGICKYTVIQISMQSSYQECS